jgi:DNA-binding NtrC family response regulator
MPALPTRAISGIMRCNKPQPYSVTSTYPRSANVFEREYHMAQMSRFGCNLSRPAEFVGLERLALYRKLKALGIN